MTSARWSTSGEAALVLSGEGVAPAAVSLVGPRARVSGEVVQEEGAWTATLPLVAARWGGAELPLPTGTYAIEIDPGEATALHAPSALPLALMPTLRASLEGWSLRVGPPVDPAYDSGEGQNALERRYATAHAPLENAVFFESF